MIEEILKNTAYLYYPRNLDAKKNKQSYINSNEFKALLNTINLHKSSFPSEGLENLKKIMMKMSKDLTFVDGTLFNWLDRAYDFQIHQLLDNKIYSICTNISILIPFYSIYVLEVSVDPKTFKWISLPKLNDNIQETIFKNEIHQISIAIENYLGYFAFPKQLHSTIIDDINFNDIHMGDFTLFNAFFLDEKNIKS